jgi:excisionase family DNA binding protein
MTDTDPRGPATQAAVLLDVGAVAEILGCSVRHVYRLADRGAMPRPLKVGALVRWPRLAIERWISDGCPAEPKRGRP